MTQPNPEDMSALLAAEEAKRDRNYNALERWKHIQAQIKWAEEQLPPEQRRNRPRWASYSVPTPLPEEADSSDVPDSE